MTDMNNTLNLIDEYLLQGGHAPGIDADALDAESCLVAAAPDLLAALEGALDALEDSGEYANTARLARAAIAKAKGE